MERVGKAVLAADKEISHVDRVIRSVTATLQPGPLIKEDNDKAASLS